MGLNLNYAKEDGQQADYWKISRVENWFQGTTGPQYAANVNTLGFTNETYRDQGAPSVDENMYTCPYSGARDYYEYQDLTGVSGEMSTAMANMMLKMSDKMQIVAITHLPQVAAKGTQQLKVYKTNYLNTTNTDVKLLSSGERVDEIAKMLSGDEISDSALNHAKELLN